MTYTHLPLEHYALIGNAESAALVGCNGSIDWLCLPRFDSPACFAALLGTAENGRWMIAPEGEVTAVRQSYVPETLVLETEFETPDGVVALIDFMPSSQDLERRIDVVRVVEGRKGVVRMQADIAFRFDYGHAKPWVRRRAYGLSAVAGPDALTLSTPAELKGEGFHHCAHFQLRQGEQMPFVLTWHPSHLPAPLPYGSHASRMMTEAWQRDWAARCRYEGPYRDAVVRSLLTLKALTYRPTGGIVAAPTTSLPEQIGGSRNWDYRFCWVRDATLTLYAFLACGYVEEARSWRRWLLRAAAGDPAELQIMYSVAGERRLEERELPWLSGYEGSRPVRVGNAAHSQLQIDVYGEVMDAFHAARRWSLEPDDDAWRVQKTLLQWLEEHWDEPDEGIWEVRGPRRHFTHSKVMAWVAFDRAVKSVESHGLEGPVDRWRAMRDAIHANVCAHGFNAAKGCFTQFYGSEGLDAALLMIPLVGFLPAEDPRVLGTIAAIERELAVDGLILRYRPEKEDVDGLPGDEGAFLACSFWLVDALALCGRREDARRLFERLLSLRSPTGLLAEEYDVKLGRLCGNYPQAFSHVALINAARSLAPIEEEAPGHTTPEGEPERAAREKSPAATEGD